jgi:nucleotide-binding universal stress UspA family protein
MVKITKILCPVDFSLGSEHAVQFAARLANASNAKLKILHVVSPFITSSYDFPVHDSNLAAKIAEGANLQLHRLIGKLKLTGINVETDVQTGDVSSVIERDVRKFKPDILALGVHGRRGFERWIIGSITERLLRRSAVPILAVPVAKSNCAEVRRILVTTDFSQGSNDALAYAFSIAGMNRSKVILLHVLEDARALISDAYRQQISKNVQQRLSRLVTDEARNLCEIDIRVEAGTPYHVILRGMKMEKIDLLVMNIHGISMLDRALLGTTAERVIRASARPMLLIPAMKGIALKPRLRKEPPDRNKRKATAGSASSQRPRRRDVRTGTRSNQHDSGI